MGTRNFDDWWKEIVKDGQWTTLERLAALQAWEDQERFYLQQAKFAPEPSAEDYVDEIIRLYESHSIQNAVELLESFAAAQRQAGREEADDRAFKILEAFGVPRGRAETVENGIMVLQDRMRKGIRCSATMSLT